MSYILSNPGIVLELLWEHILISGTALTIAILIALPLGVFIAPRLRLTGWVLGAFGIIYTIPSIALIILFIPVFGLSARPVIAALILYAQVILVRNLVVGLRGVDPVLLEAAEGMGMSAWQRLLRVELPLALPVLIAGLRIAAVVTIAIATIGAKFGAGGLGRLLFDGIAQAGRYDKIWAGAITVAALALVVNQLLLRLERAYTAREQAPEVRRARERRLTGVSRMHH
jgi:osmoprotectant transport system permease protein